MCSEANFKRRLVRHLVENSTEPCATTETAIQLCCKSIVRVANRNAKKTADDWLLLKVV